MICQHCHISSAYPSFTCIIDCSTLHILVCSSHNRPVKNIMHYEWWHEAFDYEPCGGHSLKMKVELVLPAVCTWASCVRASGRPFNCLWYSKMKWSNLQDKHLSWSSVCCRCRWPETQPPLVVSAFSKVADFLCFQPKLAKYRQLKTWLWLPVILRHFHNRSYFQLCSCEPAAQSTTELDLRYCCLHSCLLFTRNEAE